MERDLDVRLEAHRLASQRRAAGLPSWAKTVRLGDVFHNEALPYAQRRDIIVRRLQASGWPDEDYLVKQLVLDIGETVDAEEFDGCWGELLERADLARVWIDTMSS